MGDISTDSIFTASGGQSSAEAAVATLQSGKKKAAGDPASAPMPNWMGGGGDIWSQLSDQYGKVDSSFSTAGYDEAANAAQGNITSASEEAANAAGADYASRARQAGGNAEGAGLVKAEALVSGRREVEDVRLKQMQYDIAQKEAARQLAATIAGKMGDLRLGYLQNLTSWNETLQKDKTSVDVANIGANATYAGINENARQFDLLHQPRPWNGTTSGSGLFTGTDQYGHPLSIGGMPTARQLWGGG